MRFREVITQVNDRFIQLCKKHDEDSNASAYDTTIDVYAVLKELYDKDKKIRLEDSLSLDTVKRSLQSLRGDAEVFNVDKKEHIIYRTRFIEHIAMNLDLIDLISQLTDADRSCESLEERILLLLNYCILLDRTAYFQSLFVAKLDELNSEIVGISNADYLLFFRLGSLNFKRHLYPEAIANLKRAIESMQTIELHTDTAVENLHQKADLKAVLFKAKMLMAVSYEFQGKFPEAIEHLIGIDIDSVFDRIKLDELLYEAKTDGIVTNSQSLDVIIDQEEESVIKIVGAKVVEQLLELCKDGSCLKYASETDEWFHMLSVEDKESLRYLGGTDNNSIRDKYFRNESSTNASKYTHFQHEHTHEVLHILAHTLNEYGVRLRNSSLISYDATSAKKAAPYIVTARGLMLFVAKNQEFMVDCQKCLTCLATLHAEVGDFVAAKSQLIENVGSNYYYNKDMLVQAEIEFFYYIVSMMDNPIANDERRDEFFSKYINCCYNCFDYDALAQIEMYRFKYSIAKAIVSGTREVGKDRVQSNIKELQSSFVNFLNSTQAVYVNDWTKNEYEKTKTMFQLLAKYYGASEINMSLSIVDLAKKYLYLYANKSLRAQCC